MVNSTSHNNTNPNNQGGNNLKIIIPSAIVGGLAAIGLCIGCYYYHSARIKALKDLKERNDNNNTNGGSNLSDPNIQQQKKKVIKLEMNPGIYAIKSDQMSVIPATPTRLL